jgi:hypothetical protein
VKLAMALLIAILACCLVGVTVFRGERAWTLIFSTLWFNGLLVSLVVNVVFCFFPRMWGRKLTLISLGMVLFHLSFVAILGGIVYNSLFYFRGLIRLTEGETLPSGQIQSYDLAEYGRFFDFSKLKGETTLLRMHRGYKVDGADKILAYEVAVGEESSKKQGIIYITKSLDHNGFSYFNEKEGYSVLVMLSDKQGKELYGAHIPLQSIQQKDKKYLYITGTKESPGSLPFPQDPLKPLFDLQVAYRPEQGKERRGDAFFWVWPLSQEHGVKGPSPAHAGGGSEQVKAVGGFTHDQPGNTAGQKQEEKPIAEGKAPIGERFDAGDYSLSPKEIRYWVGMRVRYEPGKPIVLTSLWVGFGGMVITFIGRMRRGKKQSINN